MNCQNCNTPVDAGARFCKNCGSKLNQASYVVNSPMSQDTIYLLIVLIWETVTWLVWYVVNKVVVPMAENDGNGGSNIGKIYDITGWTVDGISIVMHIAFSVMTKNKTLRTVFIIMTVVRLGIFLAYRVFNKE